MTGVQTCALPIFGRNLSEAARGSNEISAGIVKVAEIAKDTAGGSENTQKAAEELARLATELRELTLRFRYSDADSDETPGASRVLRVGRPAPARRGNDNYMEAAS